MIKWIKDVARSIFFDNSNTDFDSDNVQEVIEEIGASSSPGFSWGRSGNSNNGTWLKNEGVSSNRTGRYIFVSNPEIFAIFVSTRNQSTYTITVYEHEGDSINLTALDTLTVTNDRGGFKTTNVSATQGRQLAVRVTSGSGREMVAGVIIKGNT